MTTTENAEMQLWAEEIRDTIIAGLGGMRALRLMIDADNFTLDWTHEYHATLHFKFKGSRKVNMVSIRYQHIPDAFYLEFYKLTNGKNGIKFVPGETFDYVMIHELRWIFEDATNLILEVPKIIFADDCETCGAAPGGCICGLTIEEIHDIGRKE